MKTVGAYEAKTHLARLLDEVENGESITITKHGREVARLVPINRTAAASGEVVAALRAARVGVCRGSDLVRDMINDGRR